MRKYRCFLVILFLATGLSLRADTLKLKDGTVLEGEITAEDDSAISIYLEFSRGTITQTRRISKAEIAEIVRWTPEQRANWRMQRDYERLEAYRLNAKDSYLIESYDQTIDVFCKFLNDHPDSPYASNVTARVAEWKAERALVSAGNIKFRGRWSPVAEVGPLISRERGQKLLEQARWLVSQRRFESAILELQVVVYMKDHPELVSQAKPLLTSAYQQALASLEHESQQLSNDLTAATARIAQARQTVNDAEFSLTQALTNSQSSSGPPGDSQQVLDARTAVNTAHNDLNSALDRLEQLRGRTAVLAQRLTALRLQARDVNAVSTASQAQLSQSTAPPASPDSPEVLVSMLAWVKKNWPGMLIALLAILFLMSRMAKD